MTFLPKLLAFVAIVLPPGSGERSEPVQRALAITPLSVWVHESAPPSLRFITAHLPVRTEWFFERLEEMACDEEDSTRAEHHGIVPMTLLDYGSPVVSNSFASLGPASSQTPPVIITVVLRC
jgi:hypothetical protein